ncbi:MAG: sigma-70 family RNA polymerase sigma factor [Agathobacter sp.]|nr:sigma-70 family RNA polymerase sigma factor [Agathobacter sp.]
MEKNRYILAVENYSNTVYRAAYQYCGNKSDAEDVVQNTFIKLLQEKKDFESEEYLKRWLIRVAVNEAKNISMSFWKKRISSLEDNQVEKTYEFHSNEQSDLYEAVMHLPAKYRIVVHLYYFEDYSTKEIAEILKIKETTVQTQLMRARGKLKEMLKEAWKDE